MTSIRLPALAAIALAATVIFAPIAARADTLQEANALFKQGQFGPALEKAEMVLVAKPKDAQARFLKGLILTEMNRQNDAIAIFTKLTEDYPELPEPYNNLAVLYAQQRQFEKAKNALEMAIRTHPSYATAHENLGDIYARMASQAYDKALQLDSSNASAQTKLSMIRDLMGASSSRPPVVATRSNPAAGKIPVPIATSPTASAANRAPPPVDAKSAVEKPVETKPVTPTVDPKPAPASATLDVEKAVQDWAAAWSRKDVKAYLASYAKDFQTPGKVAHAEWEAERGRRVNKPGTIQVTVEKTQVTLDGDHATVRFRQYYRSASLKTSSNKTLVLVRRDSKWLIQQERVGN